jgi:hypothetical protein
VSGRGHLRWSDDGGVGGDDDADDGEWLSTVWASVLSAGVGDVVRERGRDGEDAGDDVRDEISAGVSAGEGVVAVAFAPGGLTAFGGAEPLA